MVAPFLVVTQSLVLALSFLMTPSLVLYGPRNLTHSGGCTGTPVAQVIKLLTDIRVRVGDFYDFTKSVDNNNDNALKLLRAYQVGFEDDLPHTCDFFCYFLPPGQAEPMKPPDSPTDLPADPNEAVSAILRQWGFGRDTTSRLRRRLGGFSSHQIRVVCLAFKLGKEYKSHRLRIEAIGQGAAGVQAPVLPAPTAQVPPSSPFYLSVKLICQDLAPVYLTGVSLPSKTSCSFVK